MKFSIVIPCFNEEKNIPLIFERFNTVLTSSEEVTERVFELILVDNGSRDSTRQVIQSLLPNNVFAKMAVVDVNQGYGYGILQGLGMAQGDYIGWTHADLQTDPADVVSAVNIIEKNGAPNLFIKGNRRGRPLFDTFFTVGMSVFESLYMNMRLVDINAQPTIFPFAFYKEWKNPPHDFALDLYALYMAQKAHLKAVRFPVKFPPRLHGQSHWNTGLAAKWKFIKRTIEFSTKLKKEGIS